MRLDTSRDLKWAMYRAYYSCIPLCPLDGHCLASLLLLEDEGHMEQNQTTSTKTSLQATNSTVISKHMS